MTLTAALISSSAALQGTENPNILWLVIDDMGIEMSCYGEKAIQPPNIDRLASEGMRFSNAFVTATVCSPVRSAMITGMYQTTIGAHEHQSGRGSRKIHLPSDVILPPYYPRDSIILDDWAQYLDCVRLTDKQVGEIIQRLEDEGILDNTLIILMGDGGISHARGKQFLYDEGIRTPFIVRGPGITKNSLRHDLIEHIDMAAISLAFAGIEVPSWMQGRDVFSKYYQKREAIFSARDRCGETVDRIRAVRTDRFKYIRNFYPDRPHLQPTNYKDSKSIIIRLRELYDMGKLDILQQKLLFAPSRKPEELYDIQVDPFETINLADDPWYADTLRKMRLMLEQWSHNTHDPPPESPEIYEIEIAIDPFFHEIIDRDIVPALANYYAPSKELQPNKYYWRVRYIDADAQPSPWSLTESFSIRPCSAQGVIKVHSGPRPIYVGAGIHDALKTRSHSKGMVDGFRLYK